jgi:hypothetical protein
MRSVIVLLLAATALAACQHTVRDEAPAVSNLQARDITLMAPTVQFQETPQSRSVIVGSQVYAAVNACHLIKRYRVITNDDFTGTMNLMKYRASLMGAKWITVIQSLS